MANRFFIAGGVDNLWSTTGNWSTTSGGGGGSAVPLATDDVFFDANSPNCTINTTGRVGLSLNFTGYTNTITFDQTLTITNNITLAATMTFAGTAALISINTCTFTSNGKTIGVPFTVSGVTCTLTLSGAMVCGALLTLGTNTSAVKTVNSSTIAANAGLTLAVAGSNGVVTGTTVITLGGGTLTGVTGCTLVNPLTFNASAFTVTGTLVYRGGPLTYTAGTATMGTSTLSVGGAATSLAIAGMTWPTLTITGGTFTHTLTQDLNCVDLNLLPNTSATLTLAGAFNINCSGNLTSGGSTNGITTSTTCRIICTGAACVWSNSNTAALRVDLDINTAGTFTISGQVNYAARTLRWIAGTLIGVSTPKIRINFAGTTLDLGGAPFPAILYVGSSGGTTQLVSDIVFSATGGMQYDEGGSPMTRSSVGGVQRKITLAAGNTIDITDSNFTDIDCGDGPTLYVYAASLINTDNIVNLMPYTVPFSAGSSGSGGGGGVPVLGSSWA